MDSKMRDRIPQRLSPHFFSSDEGPETGEDSDDDMVTSYLPNDRLYEESNQSDQQCSFDSGNSNIPSINITLHTPNSNHVLEAEICQLADIQENIQKMREGELILGGADRQRLEARLSTSCPSLAAAEAAAAATAASNTNNNACGTSGGTSGGGAIGKHSVSTRQPRGGQSGSSTSSAAALYMRHHGQTQNRHRRRSERHRSPSMSTGESDEDISEGLMGIDLVDGSRNRDRSSSLRPASSRSSGPLEAVNQLAKSVSTPHIPNENGTAHTSTEEHSTGSSKSSRRRAPEPTHVFIQKLIAEHGFSKQGSGTDSETEGDDLSSVIQPPPHTHHPSSRLFSERVPNVSPQLTLAEFLQNPALVEDDPRKRTRRNKKERGASLFSLRKKKDKKDSGVLVGSGASGKGLSKAGSAASLQSRPVSAPRLPQHSSSMSSLKRYPASTSQFYLARSESSKSTEEKEEMDGDREYLLEGEIPPGMELPESFPVSLRNLDTDPFLRIQKEEPDTWANSVPRGVASALKPHEAKRQEHIYEFIITEKHHCQLLKVMQKVFCEGMTTYLDMKPEVVDRLFPQLDALINIHFQFLRQLRERQDSTAVIPTIADILLEQFSFDAAQLWETAYGSFCSQHSDAVALYKDLMKSDRRFQEFVQQCSLNPLLRKMGIPECILTVTTRITKYPLLIEPLIKTAKERPEEQQKLRHCHHLVKSILVNVNNQVAEKERGQRLIEIYNKMDARSYVQNEGKKFKKADILLENRKLLFEGVAHLVNPLVGQGSVSTNSRSSSTRNNPPPLVNVLVLSDVMLFLQETSQKYTFVTPEQKSGLVGVHTLIAREKPGSDNKALYLISTNDKDPVIYELCVVQPRDRQDWIAGIRRAVDLSSGGSIEDREFETEAEQARKQLESKYMKQRQLTGELRGKDMELGRILEDKMRVLAELLEEQGLQVNNLAQKKYTKLVQEREESVTKEDLLQQVQEAAKLANTLYSSGAHLTRSASSVGEHHSTFPQPVLPRRAETFGGFDASLLASSLGKGSTGGLAGGLRHSSSSKQRSESCQTAASVGGGHDHVFNSCSSWSTCSGVPAGQTAFPPLLTLNRSQQLAAFEMTHYLNNIMCLVTEHFTSLQEMKVELAECRERAALTGGRYNHNQQLEELRNRQDQFQEERRQWQHIREEQDRDMQDKREKMAKLQATLEQERKDVEEQRNNLYRKLEALSAQGIDIGPNMTVIGPSLPPNHPEPQGFIMEVRKAVSPPSAGGGQSSAAGSGSEPVGRKTTSAMMSSHHHHHHHHPHHHLSASVGSLSSGPSATLTTAPGSVGTVKKHPSTVDVMGAGAGGGSGKNQHLLSATNETKGEMVEVKQQIPSKLAKLSLSAGTSSKSKEKKSIVGSNSGGILGGSSSNISVGAGGRPSLASSASTSSSSLLLSVSSHHNQPSSLHSASSSSSQQQPQQQLLPFKLSEMSSDRKSSVSPKSAAASASGYQKLSSSSFAEERVGRSMSRPDSDLASQHYHQRTGSSPAAMSARAMANTLPKSSMGGAGGGGSGLRRPDDQPQAGGSPASPDRQQIVQRVNYADSGEQVFFF